MTIIHAFALVGLLLMATGIVLFLWWVVKVLSQHLNKEVKKMFNKGAQRRNIHHLPLRRPSCTVRILINNEIMNTQSSQATQQLTISEAIAQGYTHFGYEGLEDQPMHDLIHLNDADFKEGTIVLFDKEPCYMPGISGKEIAEMIAEQLQCDISDNTTDDTNDVYDIIIEMNFDDVAERVNKAVAGKNYYSLTTIRVINSTPNPETSVATEVAQRTEP